MSSLQKFHRRTNGGAPASPFTTLGSGNGTVGFWIGDVTTNKLIIAPKTTERSGLTWGSANILRGTTSTTNGLANTNTLAGFGQAAHPAAYYAKNLTTGGYNTWYLPAYNELLTIYSNKSATPYATNNGISTDFMHSSTEVDAGNVMYPNMGDGSVLISHKLQTPTIRAVRRA